MRAHADQFGCGRAYLHDRRRTFRDRSLLEAEAEAESDSSIGGMFWDMEVSMDIESVVVGLGGCALGMSDESKRSSLPDPCGSLFATVSAVFLGWW